jgi:hypothetical protein
LPPIATAEKFDLAHTVAMRYAPSPKTSVIY